MIKVNMNNLLYFTFLIGIIISGIITGLIGIFLFIFIFIFIIPISFILAIFYYLKYRKKKIKWVNG